MSARGATQRRAARPKAARWWGSRRPGPRPARSPTDRGYGRTGAALGPERTAAWLVGALEVDELALAPRARGAGLAAALLESVTAPAVDGRCWLLTSARAEPAVRLYHRLGWQPALAVPDGSDLVAYLGPLHPRPGPAGTQRTPAGT